MPAQWEKYYTSEELKLIQKIELENLRVFIDVCRQLNLEYFLYGGTLLGAEKYQGFIPWDDDVDVALTRKNYEKFIRYAPSLLPKDYFLQTPYNCPQSPYPYAKLRRRGTRYVEYANRNVPIETGIYIDIYPVDKIPQQENLRKKQFSNVRRWILLYVCRQVPLYDKKVPGKWGGIKRLVKWVICQLVKIFPPSYYLHKIDRYMQMYNGTNTQHYAALNSPNYNNIYKHLYPLAQGVFEGIPVKLPGNYQAHLRKRYGDYTQLPPEDKRVGHVPYILDFGDILKYETDRKTNS